jgi:hypothetical protein
MAALGRLATQRRRLSAVQLGAGEGPAEARRHRKSSVDTYSNPSYEDAAAVDGSSSAPTAVRHRNGATSGRPPTAAAAAHKLNVSGADSRDGGGRYAAAQVPLQCVWGRFYQYVRSCCGP